MTDASRLLRGTLTCLVALIIATGFVLPANALPVTTLPQASAARGAGTAGMTRAAQWWLAALNVPQAWRAAPGEGAGVIVAVLSTGIDAAHPDLARTVTIGRDYCDSGRTAASPFWGYEGTAVASLLAGHGHGADGADGITGVAPGARILGIQVTLEYNDPLISDAALTRQLPDAIAAGIRYAVSHGATVVALPLDPGTLGPTATGDPAAAGGSPAERAAVSYALAHGVVLIAPAGDNGTSTGTINYPAAYPGVVAVGASARDGQLASFTSRRSYVALTAPGIGMTVADPEGGYATLASTDMSAALTAGVAALIRSRFPLLSAVEVASAIEHGTRPPGKSPEPGSGHGGLDAAGALAAAAALAAYLAPTRTAPPATPAPRANSRYVDARQPGPGAVAGSLLRDAVIAACALIAALAGVLALAAARRRSGQYARRGAPRSGQGGSHARRPRAILSRPRAGSVGEPRADRASGAPPSTPRIVPMSAAGTLGAAGRARRSRKTTGKPPWEPASEPAEPLQGLPALPVLPGLPAAGNELPRRGQHAALPPWERAPEEFAAAPVPVDAPEWPSANTGPMYMWNPNATTAPQPAIDPDTDPGAR